MALIFLGVLIAFTVSSFEFQQTDCKQQTALTSLLMMNGRPPIHPTSIHWIIGFGGNDGVLTKPATEAKTNSRVLKCTIVNLVCLIGERH